MNPQAFLQSLGRISVQAGVLVLMVLLAQWLFRRELTPRWRCALWFLVMVRLVLPFSPGSAASIFNLMPQWGSKGPVSPATTVAPGPEFHPTAPALAEPVPRPRSQLAHPVQTLDEDVKSGAVSEPSEAPKSSDTTSASQPPLRISPARTLSLPVVLFWGWLTGVVVLAGYVGVSSFRLAWRCRGLPCVSDASALAMLDQCANRLGVGGGITVAECAEVTSPALFGVFRPRLLLPKGFTQNFSMPELRFVFLHELAHVKRRDLPLNWLVTLLQILHWFNPLVWLGFSRWRSDRELACDALALEAVGADQHREYGRTILHVLENLVPRVPVPGLVGILEDKRQLQRRIGMIANFRPGERWGLLSFVLLAVLALVGLTDAQTPRAEKPAASTSSSVSTNNPPDDREVRIGTDPKPEATDTNVEVRSLTIAVVDPTGKPLPGAEVHASYISDWTKPQPRRLTDENGKFTLRFPSVPKEYRREMSNFGVSASHKDYAQRAVMWTSSGGDVYSGMPGEVTVKLERGISVGGIVQDERGAPLAGLRVLLSGSGYRGFTMGNTERKTHEYSELWMSDKKSPAAVTDSAGRWTFARFPSDLKGVEVTFIRPDDARESFSTEGGDGLNQRPRISFEELKAQTAVVKLRAGSTVRGIVVDEAGKLLSGVTIKEGYGHGNIVRIGEFVTGEDGRFERPHRAPRQWIYTASRVDRATTSLVAQVEPGMPEIRIVMPPAKPLLARVRDETGKPLADVEFRIDQYRSEGQILDWSGSTDASGMLIWSNAPSVPVTFYALSKPRGASRKVKVAGGDPEKLVVLSREAYRKIKVQIKAMDAQSRQPVKVEKVNARYEGGGSPFTPLSEPNAAEFSVEINRDAFRVGMYPSYELQLAAAGYEALTTEFTDFDLGDQDLELALHRSGGADELTVLQPDGTPAAGARLWARTAPDGGNLFINAPGRYYGDRLAKEQAGDDGRIKLPGAPGDAPVVIAHTNGFFDTTMAELRRRRELRLRAYGNVEGRLLVAGKPKGGASVSLTTRIWSPSMAFHLSYIATTDADGHFAFTQVPAGEYKLYRWSQPKASRVSGRAITETYQFPVTVSAGQSNVVEYASTGRPVIGQAMAESGDASVNWQNDVHTLSLKLPGVEEKSRANREDYATFVAFRKANDASFRSETQIKQSRLTRTYGLEMETDGSFRVEDVPPGTYELRIRVTKPDESQRHNPLGREEELGSLVREIVVPEGRDTLDLGTLKVAVKEVVAGKSSPAVELSAVTLEGKSLSLAQFKGKNVVLAFWTSWSDRCTEQLAEFQKLQREHGSDAQLEILGVSVDNDVKAARSAVDARRYTWSQGWLDREQRAQATAAFDVNMLPAIFLIDPEGRVIGRDLEGDRLRASVRRVLQKK